MHTSTITHITQPKFILVYNEIKQSENTPGYFYPLFLWLVGSLF